MNGLKFLLPVFALAAELLPTTTALAAAAPRITSIVTGANGYIGREIVHTLLKEPNQQQVLCLVRPARIPEEPALGNIVLWNRIYYIYSYYILFSCTQRIYIIIYSVLTYSIFLREYMEYVEMTS
jgi:hypothetical protein